MYSVVEQYFSSKRIYGLTNFRHKKYQFFSTKSFFILIRPVKEFTAGKGKAFYSDAKQYNHISRKQKFVILPIFKNI